MNKVTLAVLAVLSSAAMADDNYNNTNTSTQTISNDYSGQDHSSVVNDSSVTNDYSTDTSGSGNTTTDNGIDNSSGDFRNNNFDVTSNSGNYSNNQTSTQNIDNTKTVNGNLIDGSYNGTNAGGGNISATGGNATGGTSSAAIGDTVAISKANGDQQQGQGQGQGQRQQANVTVAPNYSQTYNQVRQNPMAWSPNLAMSMSQENCNNSVSLGGSGAGIAAGSIGFPVTDDECNRRRDAIFWMNAGQPMVACYRMLQDDANSNAMKAAGLDCKTLAAAPIVEGHGTAIPPSITPIAADTNKKLDALFKHAMSK